MYQRHYMVPFFMIWPFFRFWGRNLSKFLLFFGKFKAPKNILKSTDLYSLRQFLSQRKSEGIEIRKFHKIPFLATQQWLWRRPLQPLWIAQWTILNFKWPHSLSSSLSKWLLYRYSLHQMNIFLMARLQCLRPGQYFFITKGQEISEGNWCLQFSPKNNKNIYFPNFCSSI